MRPNDALALGWRGDTYMHDHNWGLAIGDYERAILIKPDYADAYNGRCFARAAQGYRLELAAADCDRALSLAPNSRGALNSRGILRLKTGDNTGAIAQSFGKVQMTPTSILINKRGEIVKRYVGEPDFPALHALVEKLLAET